MGENTFRKMRRFRQQVSDEKCHEILKKEWRGVLSMLGENGYPYGIPMDFLYDEEKNRIYFHGAKEGFKIDSLKKCNKVCFTVHDEGFRKEGKWPLNITSVVSFGTIHPVTDEQETVDISRAMALKYFPTREEVEEELRRSVKRVLILELRVEHMTGKLVNES